MKLLVAGSNGYVGSHVTDLLRNKGFDVYVYRREQSSDAIDKRSISRKNVEMHGCFDVIINCARPHWSVYSAQKIAHIEGDFVNDLNKFAYTNATKIHTSGVWLFGHATQQELQDFTLSAFDMVKLDEKTIQNVLSLNWHVVYCPSIIYGGNSCQLRRIVEGWEDASVTVAIPSIGYNQYVHVFDVAQFYYTLVSQTNIVERQHVIAESKGYTPESFAELLYKNAVIKGIFKINWEEFELRNDSEAIDIEKLNLKLLISPYFKEKHTINRYLEEYTNKYIQCSQE